MIDEISLCKQIIISYLNTNLNPETVADIYNINAGDNKLLYGHISALSNIFAKAKEDLERVMNNEKDNKNN